MNTKRYVMASLAGFAFIFIYEWLFHGMLLEPLYTATVNLWRSKEECKWIAMLAGQMIFPLMFTYIFTKGYENKGIPEGIRYGVLIGLLFLPSNLIFYAVMPLPSVLAAAWILGGIIEMAVLGAIVAGIYKN